MNTTNKNARHEHSHSDYVRTQSKLSEAVDIDRAEISKYESGQKEKWDLRC